MIAKSLISLTRRVVSSQSKNGLKIQSISSFGTRKNNEFFQESLEDIITKNESGVDQPNILYARQPGDTGGKHHDHNQHTSNKKDGKGKINEEYQYPGTSAHKEQGSGQNSGDIFRDPEAAKKHVQDDLYDRGGTTEQAPIVNDPNHRKKQDPIKEDTKEQNDKDKFSFDENAENQRQVKMAILRSNIASTYALATLLRAQNLVHPFNYDDSLGRLLRKTEDILRDLQERGIEYRVRPSLMTPFLGTLFSSLGIASSIFGRTASANVAYVLEKSIERYYDDCLRILNELDIEAKELRRLICDVRDTNYDMSEDLKSNYTIHENNNSNLQNLGIAPEQAFKLIFDTSRRL